MKKIVSVVMPFNKKEINMTRIIKINERPKCREDLYDPLYKELLDGIGCGFFDFECLSCGAQLEIEIVPIPEFHVEEKIIEEHLKKTFSELK
jgi:hypothetical protein